MALATVELLGSISSANSSIVTLWFPVSNNIIEIIIMYNDYI